LGSGRIGTTREPESPPVFSVIVPTYNRPTRLRECLSALRALEYPPSGFEVIVVDDGSEPPVPGEVSVRMIRSPRNEGPAAARNRGAAQARGAFLAFVDDDCLPRADWLTELERSLGDAPGCVVGGPMVNGFPDDLGSIASAAIVECALAHYNADPGQAQFLVSANLAMPADLFRRVGGFDAALRTAEDRDFCQRCRQHGVRLVYATNAIVVHRQSPGLRVFWRRHYDYGRGAWHYWRGKAPVAPVSFYGKLVLSPLSRSRGPRALLAVPLVLLSQIASALGLLAEWWRPAYGRKE
jgi:GT2 family glycosyltransferase